MVGKSKGRADGYEGKACTEGEGERPRRSELDLVDRGEEALEELGRVVRREPAESVARVNTSASGDVPEPETYLM